ncbi:MCE family protein [Angustibacter luteus]|uniref:MCE family protein n=1 Tax=Angustibacter luteus TaxID=658456 RepID=A0ABW1JG05_9ACTN
MAAKQPAGRALARYSTHAYGLVFLLVLALLLALSVAMYQQRFTPVTLVTLRTDHIGNQLQTTSDVKIRGLVVGQVRKIEHVGDGAQIELALQPDQVGAIPANVSARLLPKTLFGERYVDLVTPDDPARTPLRAGDVIGQDRTSVAIELEQVFDNLLPLLRTVKPAQLATTLNAMATALEGRGKPLGENLVLADKFLTAFNPNLPTLKQDISGLADVASIYADAAPDLLKMARNLSVTSQTLVEKQSALAGFLAGTTGFANTATSVLNENEDRIIRLGRVSRPTLDLLKRYSPIYACFAQGLAGWVPRIDQAFGDSSLHITLEVVPQRPAYQPGEEPAWIANRAPDCKGLPGKAGSQAHPYTGDYIPDGTANVYRASSASALPSSFADGAAYTDPQSGDAGTAGEQAVTDALFAPAMGTSPDAMPDISNLLLGPLVRGTEVNQDAS